jgi:hypothetical protein
MTSMQSSRNPTSRTMFKRWSLVLLVAAISGCGAAAAAAPASSGPDATGVVVAVTPPSAQVQPHAAVPFAAAVTGSVDTTVRWSITEAGGGTVDATGRYVAPSTTGTYHVVATSNADPTIRGTSVVTVTAVPAVAVTISPATVTATPGQVVTFGANVTGSSDQATAWSVTEGASCGSVTSAGVYTAPSGASTCHVVATSHADGTKTATATVTVQIGGSTSGLFLGGMFLIGVDGPISTDFALWSGRGMNTIVRGPPGPQGISLQTYDGQISSWNSANPTKSFKRIREPMPGWGAGSDPNGYDSGNVTASNPIGDASISYNQLLAWSQPDEPDINGALSSNMTWLQQYATKWRTADPKRPIYLNFGGNDFLVTGQNYSAAIAYADWIATDVYPYTGLWWDPNHMNDPTIIGQILDAISAITDKPKFSWVECGNVSSSRYAAGPTGPQIRTMIWNAVIHGARGYICWISDSNNNFNNSVSASEGAEIAATNSWLTSIAPVLQDQIIPPVVSGPADAHGHGIIHVGGRVTSSGRYYIVQNVSNTASYTGSITLPGAGSVTGATIVSPGATWPTSTAVASTTCTNCISGGVITDTLGPNMVHVYQVR